MVKTNKRMTEIWKQYKDTNYEVSTDGRVRNIKTGRLLKSCKTQYGYLRVDLSKNCKHKLFSVHRLVAEAFIPNPDNLPCVNHKDEDKTNNCVDNLEWCNFEYNNQYSKSKTVLQLRKDGSLVRVWSSVNEVKRHLGYSIGSISQCCKGKQYSAYGYKWSYINND